MVDRYSITVHPAQFEKVFGVKAPDGHAPQYNAAPTKLLPVSTLSGPETSSLFRWGFMSDFSNNKKLSPRLFNLPLQQAVNKPSYRKSLESNRCVIYADGFFLWKPIAKKKLSPHYFRFANGEGFRIGGICEVGETLDGEVNNAFMMITQTTPEALQPFQEDMPMIMSHEFVRDWLDPEADLNALIGNHPSNTAPDLVNHPVSPAILNTALNDKKLIEPIKPADQYGNYTLFG